MWTASPAALRVETGPVHRRRLPLRLLAVAAILVLGGAAAAAGAWLVKPAPTDLSRPPASVGAFRPGPSLLVGRGFHTTTPLVDGRVLVVGGQTHPDAWVSGADSTEVWDAATGDVGTFAHGGSLLQPRSHHTATRLPDGRVLVVGGLWWNGAARVIPSAELWDPRTGGFSFAGEMLQGRYDHSATLLPDGRVLIAGGVGGDDPDLAPLATLEVWDPRTSTFGPAGEMHVARSGQIALLLGDGRVLFVGESDTEFWDPTTGTVERGPSLVEPRYVQTATLLRDGRVLVTGGAWGSDAAMKVRSSAEVWDPATDSFGLVSPMTVARFEHAAALLPDGRVLIVGGDDAGTAEVWDPGSNASVASGPMVEARRFATATLLSDGSVLVVGDMSRSGITKVTEIWDPSGQPLPSTAGPTRLPPSAP